MSTEANMIATPTPSKFLAKTFGAVTREIVAQGRLFQKLTVDEEFAMYPKINTSYLFPIGSGLSIDGANNNHWS